MNFQFYVEKLKAFEKFKEFIKENPEAFLCSCFFVMDKEGGDNQQHFDYWTIKDKKMISFKLESQEVAPIEVINPEIPEKVSLDLDFDFNKINEMIEKKKEQEKIKNKIQKYIFSIQMKEGKHYLLATVFVSGFGLLNVRIDLDKMEIVFFEKKSFFDIMKITRKKD